MPPPKDLIAALGFTLALHPLLLWYTRRLTNNSDEPLGLLALAAATYLIWKNRHTLTNTPKSRATACILLAAYATLTFLHFPPLVRTIPALAAITCWLGLWRGPATIALLLLSLPIIASLQFYIGYPLRILTAETATILLNLTDTQITREGTQLIHQGTTIGVDPACSGIRMLWAAAFIAAALAGKLNLTWRKTITLGASALTLALLANTIRATLLVFPEAGIIHLPHWTHETIGNTCFAAAAALLIATAHRLTQKRQRPSLSET